MHIPSIHHSPVRIYILWHPGFDRPDLKARKPDSLTLEEKSQIDCGYRLARRIYAWFRVENMEGIPVYFRCSDSPPDICGNEVLVNYIIPLVEANMVASPKWRSYVAGFCSRSGPEYVYRLFPVAVEPVAYNMPEVMRKLNFIRHDLARDKPELLISRLTEVICRDLRNVLCAQPTPEGVRRSPIPGKLKIFLSHAKADDTREAVALKRYLQEETQCEAFFDETDIASGYDFAEVLGNAVEDESAGLVVIQGDYYAERPWCRREIRDFLKPVGDPPGYENRTSALFIPPVVVVQTMQGKKIARNIPDLGHAPCVRWQEGAARFVITTLLREILFGLFYRLLARGNSSHAPIEESVFINRTPDPVMVSRILVTCGKFPPKLIAHPGYGLSNMEREALREDYPHIEFCAFSQIPAEPGIDLLPKLGGQVICVSAGNAQDILEHGCGDEHNHELLLRLLRPLFRQQVSLLYGGRMPDVVRPAESWNQPVNFTGIFLDLLLSERSSDEQGRRAVSRLYNLTPWPDTAAITPQVIAQWTDICSFIPVLLEGEVPTPPAQITPEDLADRAPEDRLALKEKNAAATASYDLALRVAKIRCLSAMRQKSCCKKIDCPLPDGQSPPDFVTLAHIFVGGKKAGASGIIPGIFEEILYAFESDKPVFVIGASHGAAGLIAGWLAAVPPVRPPELEIEHYLTTDALKALHQALGGSPGHILDRLWQKLESARTNLSDLLGNRLDDADNKVLLAPDTGYSKVCQLVWTGIADLARTPSKS